jgi:tetratricopeptide (TPR) repeat protein
MTASPRLAAAALALCGAALSACATDRTAPLNEFASGHYAEARQWYESELAKAGDDNALDHSDAGAVALVQGDVEAAHRHFEEAFNSMADLSSSTGAAAMAVVSEKTKDWKGDPYERCMNGYYLGVTYWLMGDPDNAAASFKAGLLQDADSEKGEAQSDFALLWFLMGMAQREAAHEDRGAAAIAKAHALIPANQWLDPRNAGNANVLVVLDLGLGPEKYASGHHGSDLRFRRRPYRAAFADVSADGKPLGRTERAVDVYYQATTRGGKVIDHINAGKAVFKDAAIVGGAFVLDNSGSGTSNAIGIAMILIGLLTPAEADTREWSTLPGEVQVLVANLTPGEHDLRVDVKDGGGQPIAEESKTLHIVVHENSTTFAWTRALPPAVSDAGSAAVGTNGHHDASNRMEQKP